MSAGSPQHLSTSSPQHLPLHHISTSTPPLHHLTISPPLPLTTSTLLPLNTSLPQHLSPSPPHHLSPSTPRHLSTSTPLPLTTSPPQHLAPSTPLLLTTSPPHHLITAPWLKKDTRKRDVYDNYRNNEQTVNTKIWIGLWNVGSSASSPREDLILPTAYGGVWVSGGGGRVMERWLVGW